MDKFNQISWLCLTFWMHILCYADVVEDLGVIYMQVTPNKTYILVTNTNVNHSMAQSFCARNFAGKLAEIRTASELADFNANLTSTLPGEPKDVFHETWTEIWVAGKTDAREHGFLNTSSYPITNQGDKFLILSNYFEEGDGYTEGFRHYAKTDTDQIRKMLCETTPHDEDSAIQEQAEFTAYGKRYKPVFNHLTSARGANEICRRKFNGSLASITTTSLVNEIGEQLKNTLSDQAFETRNMFWVCGKVAHKSDRSIEMNSIPPDFQKGDRCVVIRTDRLDLSNPYGLVAKDCNAAEYDFLCVLDDYDDTCAEGVSSHERVVWFDDGALRYKVFLHTHFDEWYSGISCAGIKGARLPNITTDDQAHRIWLLFNEAMRGQHRRPADGIWVAGRTSVGVNNVIDLTSDNLSEGENCVMMADYHGVLALYSKGCKNTESITLCEMDVKNSVEHIWSDTHTLEVLNPGLNTEEAEHFCHVQFGGHLLFENQTRGVHRNDLFRRLTSKISMFWIHLEIERNVYGTWHVKYHTDCGGPNIGHYVNNNATECMKRCAESSTRCPGVVFKAPNNCWLKRKCDNVVERRDMHAYVLKPDGLCTAWKIERYLEASYTLGSTDVPCGAKLGFLCSTEPVQGEALDYYYIGSCGNDYRYFSSVRFEMETEQCLIMGGVSINNLCHLPLCKSNFRNIEGWLLTGVDECKGMSIPQNYSMLRTDCERLKGAITNAQEAGNNPFVVCQLSLCNETKTYHLAYIISQHESCPMDHVGVKISMPLHKIACTSLSPLEDVNMKQVMLVNETLSNVWQDCQVTICQVEKDCKSSMLGNDYTGTLSTSISGKKCLPWAGTSFEHYFRNDSLLQSAGNFCRNPNFWVEGPFCVVKHPDVTELCHLPLCDGINSQGKLTTKVGTNEYMLVSGFHPKPWEYCSLTYDAFGATIDNEARLDQVVDWIVDIFNSSSMHINVTNSRVNDRILLGGRLSSTLVRRGHLSKNEIFQLSGTLAEETGWCPYLVVTGSEESEWDTDTVADDCGNAQHFLCERQQVRYNNYQVDGGTPVIGIYDMEQCFLACKDDCRAAGFDGLEESCWHYYSADDCKPGRAQFSFTFVQKAPCDCHLHLLEQEGVELRASSEKQQGTVSHSVQQARLHYYRGRTLVLEAGAWSPEPTDNEPHLQVIMSSLYKVYGVITRGRPGEAAIQEAWVINYNISYSRDCDQYISYDKIFMGNKSPNEIVTHIFDQAIYARCLKLYPLKFSNEIAIRFDFLVCKGGKENLALGKMTHVSGTYTDHVSSRAVDGFLHAEEPWGSCLITTPLQGAHFVIDLQHIYDVEEVVLLNRRHCCLGHLRNFHIYVGYGYNPKKGDPQNRLSGEQVCAYVDGDLAPGELLRSYCNPIPTGRFVMIKNDPSDAHMLSLCEVEVYSSKEALKDSALGKPAEQSSSFDSTGKYFTADLAVDGKMDALAAGDRTVASCSHTLAMDNPWWLVDLEDTYAVRAVSVTPRNDCCADRITDLIVSVGVDKSDESSFSICNQFPNFALGETKTVLCPVDTEGRIVKLEMRHRGTITLCEVQVYTESAKVFTYGGNAKRKKCAFPFLYDGREHKQCIKEGRDKLWCGVTSNFTEDGLWGFCDDVRLRAGRYPGEGRVEVLVDTKWENVCDDNWNDVNANVVCRQLGYKGGIATYSPMFGAGKDVIRINDVACRGHEEGLMDCIHTIQQSGPCRSSMETAGVQCYTIDDTKYYGYPAIQRELTEEKVNSTILIRDPIRVPGFIESWHIYVSDPFVPVCLQVWRRMYDFKRERYMLVGESRVTVNTTGPQQIVAPHHSVRVQPGDMIGISFSDRNPIPYDHSFYCEKHKKVLYRKRAHAVVGSIYTFYEKNDPRFSCRLYSIYAQIQVEHISRVNEFIMGNYQYQIFLQLFTKESADLLCKHHMGEKAGLVMIESEHQSFVIKRALSEMGHNGSFWMNNTIDTEDHFLKKADWAPCHPEQGKRCLVMSNNNNKGEFMWYTNSCSEKHFLICQFEVADSNVTDIVIYKGDNNTSATSKKNSKNYVVPIVIPIVLILLVLAIVATIVLVNRHIRIRKNNAEYRVPNVQYRSSTADDQAFLDVDTSSVTDSAFADDASPRNISNPLYKEGPSLGSGIDTIGQME